MRILVIGVRYPPETFLRRKFEALAARGFEVHVMSASAGLPARRENGVVWHQTLSMSAPLLFRFASVVRSTTAAFFRSPLDFFRLWKHLTMRARSLPMAIATRVQLLGLSGLKPDVVHFEWNFAAVAHLPLYDFFGAPVVVSCRGSQIAIAPTSPSRSSLNSCLKESLRRADRVHAVSDATRRLAIAAGAEPSRAVVIRPAVDISSYRTAKLVRNDKRPLCVASVGSLGWVKGYEFGLQALRYALDEGADLYWKIVGGGTNQERQRLLYTIQDLELVGRVRLAGELPACSVQACLKEADIFLLPSLSEGISNAALEAMATGLPVVASNVGGMSEAVIQGESGLLVPPRDSRAMAAAFLRLARDPQLRFELGQIAREHVERHFSLDRQTDEWEAVYCDLLNQMAAGRHRVDAARPPIQSVPHSTVGGEERW